MERAARMIKLKREKRELFTATIIRAIDFTSVAEEAPSRETRHGHVTTEIPET